jgi:hypothetical protein
MRTLYCNTFKRLFAEGAKRLRAVGVSPLPDWPNRKAMEERMYDMWANQESPQLGFVVKEVNEYAKKNMRPVPGGFHGDHFDN